MTFTIDCVLTNRGFRYRVTLWNGRVAYVGNRDYGQLKDAERAAKAAGATPRASEKGLA